MMYRRRRWRPSAVWSGLLRRRAATGHASKWCLRRCPPMRRAAASEDLGAGSGACNSMAQRRQSIAHDGMARTCWVSAPWRVRVAAAPLRMTIGGPDGLFGAPVGGVERGVPQEEEHGRERWPSAREASWRGVDQPPAVSLSALLQRIFHCQSS